MSKLVIFLKGFLTVILLGIVANLIILDWQQFKSAPEKEKNEEASFNLATPTPVLEVTPPESSPSGEKTPQQSIDNGTCSQSCLLAIDKATQNLAQIPSSSTPSSQTVSLAKIFYLPLGAGSTKSQDWADVTGLTSYIDPANYGKIKSVIFEASMRIPTANGRIYIRLYNKNDGRPVWFSEISSEGPTSTLVQSLPITFDTGNKLYQVQAKTTMGYESIIDFARIKFIIE